MSAHDTTVVSVKMKKSLKAQAQAVAGQYGIPLSTLINGYVHQLVLTGQIYFPAVEVATPQMEKIIAEAEKERREGKTAGPFDTVEEFMTDLRR
jgi:addiction module RelB/DinJ family antitoxin